MKRLIFTLLLTICMIAATAPIASAETFAVVASARAVQTAAVQRVEFNARTPRLARVIVRVYAGSALIRTLSAPRRVGGRTIVWDLKTGAGTAVAPGTYGYTVTALSPTGLARTRGKVTVPAPVPVPAPTPVPTPAPTVQGRFFGAYVHGAPDSMQPVTDLEAKVAASTDVVNFYVADSEGFPINRATSIRNHGSIPLITWEFWSTSGVGVDSITNGSKDAYLREFARQSKAFGTEMRLRPFHEMNGNWYPWCGTVGPNSPAKVVAAYRHVRDVFTQEGATNVKFVWCPNNESVPNTSANAIAAYWPGESYVDFIGLDGYNFGTSYSWSTWRSFTTTFKDSYAAVAALSATKPIFIAETGCSTVGGSKSAWVNEMFSVIPVSFPRITGVCWFDTNAECDWRIDSDASTLASFKSGLATF